MPCSAVGSGQHCKETSCLLIHGIKACLLTQQVPQLRAQLPADIPPKLLQCCLEKHVPYWPLVPVHGVFLKRNRPRNSKTWTQTYSRLYW